MAMRIGEAAAAAGMTAKTLRYYEDTGLLPRPDRSPNGYRSYSQADLDRLRFIRRSRASGLSLEQTRQIIALREDGQAPCLHAREALEERLGKIEEQLRQLTELRAEILLRRERLTDADPSACEPGQVCSYL